MPVGGSRLKRGAARWSILALLVALAAPAVSLAASVQQPTPETQALAAAVDHHYNTLRSLRVEFSQRYAGMGMNRQETGTLLLKKPGRMRWTYAKPAGKVFVLDGKFAYFYAPGDTQVQRVAAKQLDDLRSPLRFLLGHTQLAKEFVGLTATASDGGYMLSGVPKGMEKRVERMSLQVTPDGTIHSMKIEEIDGAETVFTLNGEQANPPAPDSEFVFQAPKGVPVVEGMPPV
jgi:outer membrane lipoprotein carrier protein